MWPYSQDLKRDEKIYPPSSIKNVFNIEKRDSTGENGTYGQPMYNVYANS